MGSCAAVALQLQDLLTKAGTLFTDVSVGGGRVTVTFRTIGFHPLYEVYFPSIKDCEAGSGLRSKYYLDHYCSGQLGQTLDSVDCGLRR